MKEILGSLFFIACLNTAFTQKITSYEQAIDIGDSTSIVLDIDSIKVKIEHWEGKVVQVHTQVAYEEKDLDRIVDVMRNDGYDLDLIKEEKTYKLKPNALGEYWAQHLTTGTLYTIYLPKAVDEVIWLVDISMN